MKKKKMKARIKELEEMNQYLIVQNTRLLCQLKMQEYKKLGGNGWVHQHQPHTHEYRPYNNWNKVTCNCKGE